MSILTYLKISAVINLSVLDHIASSIEGTVSVLCQLDFNKLSQNLMASQIDFSKTKHEGNIVVNPGIDLVCAGVYIL